MDSSISPNDGTQSKVFEKIGSKFGEAAENQGE